MNSVRSVSLIVQFIQFLSFATALSSVQKVFDVGRERLIGKKHNAWP